MQYPGEYVHAAQRKTHIDEVFVSGKTSVRLKAAEALREEANVDQQEVFVTVENDAENDITLQLLETNDIAVAAVRDNLGEVSYTAEGGTAALGAAGSTTNYILKNTPVKAGSFTVSASGGLSATDDGSGAFATADPNGNGFDGTINYTTGEVSIQLGATSTAANNTVTFAYTTTSTKTVKPLGKLQFTIFPKKRYLEIKSTSGNGRCRLQLSSQIRWDKMAFSKTDTVYPQSILQPQTLPPINNT